MDELADAENDDGDRIVNVQLFNEVGFEYPLPSLDQMGLFEQYLLLRKEQTAEERDAGQVSFYTRVVYIYFLSRNICNHCK